MSFFAEMYQLYDDLKLLILLKNNIRFVFSIFNIYTIKQHDEIA